MPAQQPLQSWMAALGCGLLLALPGVLPATDFELSLDGRLLSSNGEPSFMEGGLGTVRFDRHDSGLQLGRARFALNQNLGERWSVHLDASMYDDLDRSPVGLTEAYLLFRPYPRDGLRFRLRAGGFYPAISLENRAAGWESPYTLSFSAINSWLAMELRTVGIEGQLDWLGTRTGRLFDLGVTGGVFGWNQGTGAVLAGAGFALTDRQTPLFGRVGQRGAKPLYAAAPFEQFDHREGLYGGVEARYLDRLVLRVVRYDNRADPTAVDNVSGAYAWQTQFDSVGLRLEAQHGWTLILQWLDGQTSTAPWGEWEAWPFRAEFALLSKRIGRSTLSARYDRFSVESLEGYDDGWQQGHAWTAAYIFEADTHWRFTLEWLRVSSSSYIRADLGGPPTLSETQLQLAVRYAFAASVR